MKNANWIVALVVGAAIGFVAGQAVNKSGGGSAGGAVAMGSDNGKTPSDLPGNYLKEADLPAGTLTGLTDQQKYAVLKSINEKHCTCGCDKDSIAQCRKTDPSCTTAPQLITQAIQMARQGKSSMDIEAVLGGGGNNAPQRPAGPPPSQVRNVATGDGYARGAKDYTVTIVEFSDYQCPFCSRVEPTIKQVMDQYGDKVRFVWRNEPLPFHPNAMPAAEAAMAAGAQGKFWEMHDLLFTNQRELSPANYEKWAQQLGLDMAKFKADLASHKYQAKIKADSDYAQQVGANGTPNFFIDGINIVGAQPFDKFKEILDKQVALAGELEKKGLKGEALYQAEIAENLKNQPKVAAQPAGAPGPNPNERKDVAVGKSPMKGSASAPVTIVEFSDFQCPFCSRVEPTIKQIEEAYGNKVKVVWKNNPLPFHPNAMPAAKAAMAAYKQGKFWEMHDLLFTNQRDLSPANYEKWAQQLGLDMAKFKADMASPAVEAEIKADADQARQVGAGGTPNFFIDGVNVVGAQPFDKFKQVIDDEIANAGKKKAVGTNKRG